MSTKRHSMYDANFDFKRFAEETPPTELEEEHYRTVFRRDYARLLHSPAFRRLVGKTQLYPNNESDFFRNRLTHSLEVAQIAKSIAIKLNATQKFADNKTPLDIDTDLVETAGLCHDLGHPPFGHQGEEALDECMRDFGGFEGNAHTLRLITKLEKKFLVDINNAEEGIVSTTGKDIRVGLNLTYRTIASILKYDKIIPYNIDKRLKEKNLKKSEVGKLKAVKGYYKSEEDIVDFVKSHVLRGKELPAKVNFKTIECQIMDLADDIAYSTYDLEDGLKAGFYDPLDILFSRADLVTKICTEVNRKLNLESKLTESDIRNIFIDIFKRWLFPDSSIDFTKLKPEAQFSEQLEFMSEVYKASKKVSKNAYSRVGLSSYLIGRFIRGVKFELNKDFPQLSKVYFDDEIKIIVEVVKTFNYESIIQSPRLKIAEYRGQEIVKKIFDTLKDHDKKGYLLMPKDCQRIYLKVNEKERLRVICDFIAGMTDRYCIEFYGRLTSELPETMFKPF